MSKQLVGILGSAALALYGWAAVEVWRSDRDPRGYEGPALLGPSAEALDRAAEARSREALAALGDPALRGEERIRRYREGLVETAALLRRSLAVAPARARTLARLAAVEWELDPDPARAEEKLALVRRAAELAPTSPAVHIDLGRLLLGLGREEALTYLSRAIALEPATSNAVVEVLRAHGVPPREMLEALPHEWRLLVALSPLFEGEENRAPFVEAVERALARGAAAPRLLDVYGEACLHAGAAERLLATLEQMGRLSDPRAEAERLRARSRAHLFRRETARALEDAQAARALAPEEPELVNYLGAVLASAGEPESAIRAWREVLGLLARREAAPAARAAIYSRIGRAEEERARPALAYDAYAMALRLDPAEPWAGQRLEEMKRAAGLR